MVSIRISLIISISPPSPPPVMGVPKAAWRADLVADYSSMAAMVLNFQSDEVVELRRRVAS